MFLLLLLLLLLLLPAARIAVMRTLTPPLLP
jgi:hypothetical protein